MNTIKRSRYVSSLPADAVAVPGFPGFFATPAGRIYSTVCRRIKDRHFGRNSCGYPVCSMKNDAGKLCFPMVHRIIAKLFVPGDHSLEVNHKDMDKDNASAANLEWVTHSENHRKAHAMRPWSTGRTGLAVIAINPETRAEKRFDSVKQAAIWAGNPTASGNISKALRSGRLAYGFEWRKA